MEPEFRGHYKLIRKVGEGGMAVVYLAHHRDVSEHIVILKELKDSRHEERFKKEANNVARLGAHQNICRIFDFFIENGRAVIVMDFVDGESLEDIIADQELLPLKTSLRYAADILKTLSFAHKKKIFHRDIKPSNIMIEREDGTVKVIDFGIAKDEEDPNMTAPGTFCGTPLFAPPEQFTLTEKVNWALADIYALGVSLYLMVTGQLPFRGKNIAEIAIAKREKPIKPSSLNPKVDSQLEKAILKSIKVNPKDRFSSANEMLIELKDIISKLPDEPETSSPTDDGLTRTVMADDIRQLTDIGKKPWTKIAYWSAAVLALTAISYGSYKYFPSGNNSEAAAVNDEGSTTTPTPGVVSPTGTIQFTIEPNADIYVDGVLLIERTNSYSFTIDTGLHSVTLLNTDAATPEFKQDIRVNEGAVSVVSHSYNINNTGEVIISVSPSGDIYFDNQLIRSGVSSYTHTASPGTHTLRVENDSAIDPVKSETIRIIAGQQLRRSFAFQFAAAPLEPEKTTPTEDLAVDNSLPTDSGKIVVTAGRISGATVKIDGKEIGSPLPHTFTLSLGSHLIQVTHPKSGAIADTAIVIESGVKHIFLALFDN